MFSTFFYMSIRLCGRLCMGGRIAHGDDKRKKRMNREANSFWFMRFTCAVLFQSESLYLVSENFMLKPKSCVTVG